MTSENVKMILKIACVIKCAFRIEKVDYFRLQQLNRSDVRGSALFKIRHTRVKTLISQLFGLNKHFFFSPNKKESPPSLTQVVLFLVLEPGKPGPEVLVAKSAFERPLLGVQDHVLLQVSPAGKRLETNLDRQEKRTTDSSHFPFHGMHRLLSR